MFKTIFGISSTPAKAFMRFILWLRRPSSFVSEPTRRQIPALGQRWPTGANIWADFFLVRTVKVIFAQHLGHLLGVDKSFVLVQDSHDFLEFLHCLISVSKAKVVLDGGCHIGDNVKFAHQSINLFLENFNHILYWAALYDLILKNS